MTPSTIAQTPRMTAAMRATLSCSRSDAWPPLTTLTHMSCESAAAPDKVSPATTARIVAGLTLSGAAALSHDIWVNVVKGGQAPEREQLRVARAAAVLLGICAIILGI